MIVLDFQRLRFHTELLYCEIEEVNLLIQILRSWMRNPTESPLGDADLIRRETEFMEAEKQRINMRLDYLSSIIDGFGRAKNTVGDKLDDALNGLKLAADYARNM